MPTSNQHPSGKDKQPDRQKNPNLETASENESTSPKAFACVLFLSQDPAQVMSILQKLASNQVVQIPTATLLTETSRSPETLEDHWLDHSHAAHYLGISKSTLYRYAEKRIIESRKIGNRLEYRRSVLDKFKAEHTRPALASTTGERYDAVGA